MYADSPAGVGGEKQNTKERKGGGMYGREDRTAPSVPEEQQRHQDGPQVPPSREDEASRGQDIQLGAWCALSQGRSAYTPLPHGTSRAVTTKGPSLPEPEQASSKFKATPCGHQGEMLYSNNRRNRNLSDAY
eukprot:gene10918-biopygen8388